MAEQSPLAMAAGLDPDEVEDPSVVPGALETAAGRKPANLPLQSQRRQKMSTGEAMKRLTEARTRLTDRIAATEQDRSGEWLAAAQGLLSPTKTGGFGESLGYAAGNVREARSDRTDRLQEMEKELLDAEVKQQTLDLQARPRLGSSTTVYHPDDVAKFPENPEQWRQIEKQTIVHSDGTTEHIFTGVDGEPMQVVSRSNPVTVREAAGAQQTGTKEAARTQHDIDQGLTATIARNRLLKARDLFAQAKTSGLKSDIAAVGTYLGIKVAGNETLPVLRNMIGKEVLSQLQSLTGTKTDFEYKKIESLNASTEQNPEANLRIIDEMLGRYDRIIDIGEKAALAAAQNPDDDLSVGRYREYRQEHEAAKEARATRGAEEPRPVPPAANTRLIEMWKENDDAYNTKLREAYESRYGWPPVDPKILSELRKKGADI